MSSSLAAREARLRALNAALDADVEPAAYDAVRTSPVVAPGGAFDFGDDDGEVGGQEKTASSARPSSAFTAAARVARATFAEERAMAALRSGAEGAAAAGAGTTTTTGSPSRRPASATAAGPTSSSSSSSSSAATFANSRIPSLTGLKKKLAGGPAPAPSAPAAAASAVRKAGSGAPAAAPTPPSPPRPLAAAGPAASAPPPPAFRAADPDVGIVIDPNLPLEVQIKLLRAAAASALSDARDAEGRAAKAEGELADMRREAASTGDERKRLKRTADAAEAALDKARKAA
jgi:hypothetical protein